MNDPLREFFLDDPSAPLSAPVVPTPDYAVTALTTPQDHIYTEALPGGGVVQVIRGKRWEFPQALFFANPQGEVRKINTPLLSVQLSNYPTYGKSVQGTRWWAVVAPDTEKASSHPKDPYRALYMDHQLYFINFASQRGYGPFCTGLPRACLFTPRLPASIIPPAAPEVLQFQYRLTPREGDAYLLIPDREGSSPRRGTYAYAYAIPPEGPARQLDGDEFYSAYGTTPLLANKGSETFLIQHVGESANVIRTLTGEVVAPGISLESSTKITQVYHFPASPHLGWAVYRPELLRTAPQANAEVAAVLANLPPGPRPPWTTVLQTTPENLIIFHDGVNMFPGEDISYEDSPSKLGEMLYDWRKTWKAPEQISLKVRVRIPGVRATKRMVLRLSGVPELLPWRGGSDA